MEFLFYKTLLEFYLSGFIINMLFRVYFRREKINRKGHLQSKIIRSPYMKFSIIIFTKTLIVVIMLAYYGKEPGSENETRDVGKEMFKGLTSD